MLMESQSIAIARAGSVSALTIGLANTFTKRGMKPYLNTTGDVLKRDAALCDEVKRVCMLIVVGLYDYKTKQELEEAKQYWQAKLAGANLKFSSIGLSGAGRPTASASRKL